MAIYVLHGRKWDEDCKSKDTFFTNIFSFFLSFFSFEGHEICHVYSKIVYPSRRFLLIQFYSPAVLWYVFIHEMQ